MNDSYVPDANWEAARIALREYDVIKTEKDASLFDKARTFYTQLNIESDQQARLKTNTKLHRTLEVANSDDHIKSLFAKATTNMTADERTEWMQLKNKWTKKYSRMRECSYPQPPRKRYLQPHNHLFQL